MWVKGVLVMENLVSTDQLYATQYAEEITALQDHIVHSSSRTSEEFSALEQRVDSKLGMPQPGRNPGELLFSSQDDDISIIISETVDPLFDKYSPTGRIQGGSALTSHSRRATESDEDIARQFWGESIKTEKLRTRVANLGKTVGAYAVKAFKALEDGLTPVLSDDTNELVTLAPVISLSERMNRHERNTPKHSALSRAVACVAIAATIPTGVALKSRSGSHGIRSTYAVEQIFAPTTVATETQEAPDTTTSTTTSVPEVTTTSTTRAPEPQPVFQQAEVKPATPAPVSSAAECSVTRLKAAPIEDVIDVAQKLINTHGLSEIGSAMLTANFTVETGNLDPLAENTSEGALGLGQWRNERQVGLPLDRDGQLDFAINIDMPRDGKSYLVKLLRDPSATFAQLRDGLAAWERYGEEGGRTELGKKLYSFMQKCLQR
jgi:hypothetical protein